MVRCVFIFFVLVANFCQAQDDSTLNIFFASNKSNLPDSARFQLIKKTFTLNPERILIIGHCDSIGSDAYNIALSKQRANAVRKLLLDNGVSANDIIECSGYGEQKPIARNTLEAERQLNRRVEVQFVGSRKKQAPIQNITSELSRVKKVKTIEKEALVVGKKIVLQNIFFVPGLHRLLEESQEVLEELANVLNDNPTLTIEIQGHVCCTYDGILDGTDREYNTNNLSVTRAKEIYDQLLMRGIAKKRLRYKGFGGSRKVNEIENTEEDKAANRRVEILILSQ
jgi:outer membrane protein OmpA-like peptidoglycan-associated protein